MEQESELRESKSFGVSLSAGARCRKTSTPQLPSTSITHLVKIFVFIFVIMSVVF